MERKGNGDGDGMNRFLSFLIVDLIGGNNEIKGLVLSHVKPI
jgi:hypothetical protein